MALRLPTTRLNWRALRGAGLELSRGRGARAACLNESCSALRASESGRPRARGAANEDYPPNPGSGGGGKGPPEHAQPRSACL